jgi:hypothetical protein
MQAGDQWFSEAQFESYRPLGLESGRALLGSEPPHAPGASLDAAQLFGRLREYYLEYLTTIEGRRQAGLAGSLTSRAASLATP